jgi:hypothetical protein
MKTELRPSVALTDLEGLRLSLHWKDGTPPPPENELSYCEAIFVWRITRRLYRRIEAKAFRKFTGGWGSQSLCKSKQTLTLNHPSVNHLFFSDLCSPCLATCSKHLPMQFTVPAKWGLPHHWELSKVNNFSYFAYCFERSALLHCIAELFWQDEEFSRNPWGLAIRKIGHNKDRRWSNRLNNRQSDPASAVGYRDKINHSLLYKVWTHRGLPHTADIFHVVIMYVSFIYVVTYTMCVVVWPITLRRWFGLDTGYIHYGDL